MDFAAAITAAMVGHAVDRAIGARSRCDGNSIPKPRAAVAVVGGACSTAASFG
jgi:hypothetical protein